MNIKKNWLYVFLTIVSLLLLVWYTFYTMLFLGFDQKESFSYSAITKMSIVLMALLVMYVSGNNRQTSFTMLWILWSVWLLVDFYFLGLKGNGISNILHATFCPMIFVLFYTMSLFCHHIRDITTVGFFLISLLSIYMVFINLSQIKGVIVGEEMATTNLVYWCLCPLPILLFLEKNWQRAIVIGVITIVVLITGKRSATIAMAFIILFFIFESISSSRHKTRNIIFVSVFVFVLLFFVTTYFENIFSSSIGRLASMREDEGSGRLQIYGDVFHTMNNNSFVDWVVGRGYGSIEVTRHSNAHNDALQMLFEFGVVGLIVYVIMIVNIIKRMIVLKNNKSTYYCGYASSVSITIMLGLVSNLIVFYSYFAFICAYWGLIEAEMVKSGLVKQIIVKK